MIKVDEEMQFIIGNRFGLRKDIAGENMLLICHKLLFDVT